MNKEQTKDAIKVMEAFIEGKKIEYKHVFSEQWRAESDPDWDFASNTYRIAQEKKRVPLTKEDFDGHPIIWMRYNTVQFMAVGISNSGIIIGLELLTLQELMDKEYQYSFDRFTWKPCYKEE